MRDRGEGFVCFKISYLVIDSEFSRAVIFDMASSSSMTCDYKLSCQCLGHSADVRGLAVIEEGLFLSASRDKTTKIWKKHEWVASYLLIDQINNAFPH